MRNKSICFVLAMTLSLGTSSCTAKPQHAVVTPVVPGGVVVPAETKPGALYRGLYVGRSSDFTCCLTAPLATLTVTKHLPAKVLVLVFYLPDSDAASTGWFKAHGVGLSVVFNGEPARNACCFHGGMNSASFELPAQLRDVVGSVTFRLRTQPAFIPHDIDPASMKDTRSLGIVLQRLFFY